MDTFRKISQGSIFKITSAVLFNFLSLLVSVYLNRYYGKDTYGLLILTYSVTSFCFLFSDFGAKQTLNRFLPKYITARDGVKEKNLINSAVVFQLSGVIFFVVLLYIFSNFIAVNFFRRPELTEFIKIAILFFISYSLMDFIFQMFQSNQLWLKESFLNIFYLVFYLGLIYFFTALFAIPLKAVLITNSIACVIVIAIGIYMFPDNVRLNRLFQKNSFSGIKLEAKIIITFGFPLLFNNLTFFILMWLDKALLGRYCAIRDVTFYYIAFSLYSGTMILFKSFYTVFMPHLASIPSTATEQIQRNFKLIFRWFLQCGILISIVMYFLIEPLINFLYGHDYLPTITIFRMLILLIIIRAITNPIYMFLLNVFSLTKLTVILSIILSITVASLDILLIPAYGYKGAVVAGLIGYILWAIGSLFISKIRKMIPFDCLLKTMFCLLLVVLVFCLLNSFGISNNFILVFILLSLYLIALKMMGEFKSEDLAIVKKFIRRY